MIITWISEQSLAIAQQGQLRIILLFSKLYYTFNPAPTVCIQDPPYLEIAYKYKYMYVLACRLIICSTSLDVSHMQQHKP